MKTHDQMIPLRNVDFPFLPLESTQGYSPGQQTAHQQRRSSTHHCRMASAADIDVVVLIHSRGGAT